jgi:uncharacterized membrane protein
MGNRKVEPMTTILIIALVIVLAGVFIQLAHMRRSHNKAWREYGTRRPFQVVNGIYTDLKTGRTFDMKEVKHGNQN